MSLLAIIAIIYAIIFIGFTLLIYKEANKRNVLLGFRHIAVAIFWPIWLVWYLANLVLDKINED